MFKFLKDKLKGAIASLTQKVEADPEPVKPEPEVQEDRVPERKGIFSRLKDSIKGKEEEPPEAPLERLTEDAKKEVSKKKKEDSIDADNFEKIIRDVDIHAPLPVETEPEPVPDVQEEEPEAIMPPPSVRTEKEEPKVEVIPHKHEVIKARAEPEQPKVKVAEPKVDAKVPERKVEIKLPEIKPGRKVDIPEQVESKGFFGRIAEAITTKKIGADEFETLFWELEVVLLENNVAVEVIEKIKEDLKVTLVDKPLPRGKVEQAISGALRKSLHEILTVQTIDLLSKVREKKPFIIAFVGVNGSGKTTTIAKVAHLLLENKMSVVLAAADTFRAAAIDQLDMHAKKLGVKIIKHDYGADPAAVAFDAVKHASAKNVDVVLIDTAGRLHSNVNLIDEMKKIIRVAKPDLKIFVGESITGNDCIEQAQQFDQAIGIDGIILSKADVDEKGGAAISVSYVTHKPILYLGMGQEYADLVPFDGEQLLSTIGL
jgi:fused signal recognition particle receptor